MTVAITGAEGFLGWHLSCRLLAHGVKPVRIGRQAFADGPILHKLLEGVDTVVHVAGVNRAESDDEVTHGNIRLAEQLSAALDGQTPHIVYANSVQADQANPYGTGKREAAEILAAGGGTFANVLLPNIFGEHGRPYYNSFVATFVHEVAHDRQPTVADDRQISLLHAQDAAQALMDAVDERDDAEIRPAGEAHRISDVLALLNEFHALYARTGDIPDVSSPFRLNLFNTYRSALWSHGYPMQRTLHTDPRGDLIETVRSHGGRSQGYVSSTRPGQVRGEHYHLHKIERFVVFRGEAEINLRRLFTDETITFRVSGSDPVLLDMPTMWVHNIRNIGDEDVITVFWADQLLDPDHPDQYPMEVEEVLT